MSLWRKEAIGRLPEFRQLIERSDNPMALWIELHLRFEDAVSENNQDLTKRLLQYASWCHSRTEGDSADATVCAVACAFYEHLPRRRDYWPMFRSWFFPHEFERLLPVFRYHASEADLQDMRKAFYGR